MYKQATVNAMIYNPKIGIHINWVILKQYPCWRRQTIALLIHELVHVWQWYAICKCDVYHWNHYTNPEYMPDIIQDVILHVLHVPCK
jgi:hypothetical protein